MTSTNRRLLITGGSGFLGTELLSRYRLEYDCYGTFHQNPIKVSGCKAIQADLSLQESIKVLSEIKPEFIIHTAALTDVDLCERDVELAKRQNVHATKHVAEVAKKFNARLLIISSDQVFDGKKLTYSEDDIPSPINNYGKSKINAEQVARDLFPDALNVRTNFYGRSSAGKKNFFDWCHETIQNDGAATLFDNIKFNPIWVSDLVNVLGELLKLDVAGVLNVAGDECCSKADFFLKLARHMDKKLSRITIGQYQQKPSTALRPLNMCLDNRKLHKLTEIPLHKFEDAFTEIFKKQV